MSEFTDELKRLDLAINLPSKTYFAIEENFKDWQPPNQLVEVPQYIADYIEANKNTLSIFAAFDEIKNYIATDLFSWVFSSMKRQENFTRAWFEGYTVKKEQLYKVVFLKTGDDEILLLKSDTFFIDWISIYNDLKYQFTEKEIKDIDERYWEFAVEVDE